MKDFLSNLIHNEYEFIKFAFYTNIPYGVYLWKARDNWMYVKQNKKKEENSVTSICQGRKRLPSMYITIIITHAHTIQETLIIFKFITLMLLLNWSLLLCFGVLFLKCFLFYHNYPVVYSTG